VLWTVPYRDTAIPILGMRFADLLFVLRSLFPLAGIKRLAQDGNDKNNQSTRRPPKGGPPQNQKREERARRGPLQT
jgi:hypothetical protein